MFVAIRRELDPNNQQATYLWRCCGASRHAYNWALFQRRQRFETQQDKERFVSFFDQCKDWIEYRDRAAPWAKELPAMLFLCALQNLDKAFGNFRRRFKSGLPFSEAGFPNPKGRRHEGRFQIAGGAMRPAPDGRALVVPKLGSVRTKEDFPAITGKVKTTTVCRVATGRWFASVLVDDGREAPAVVDGPVLGLHCGLRHFLTLSTGEQFDHPRPLREALSRLAFLNRLLSRRVKGSAGWHAARLQVAKQHEVVANRRRDFLHKLSTDLVARGVTMAVEDWSIQGMMADPIFAQAFADSGLAQFHAMLTYKQEWAGQRLVTREQGFPATQMCRVCGHIRTGEDKLPLGVLIFTCPKCGHSEDREHNAVANVAAGEH